MTPESQELAIELEALAHRAESRSSDAYDESDYERGNYYRGMNDAFTYAAARLRGMDTKAPE